MPLPLRLRYYVGPAAAKQIADAVRTLDFNGRDFEVVDSTEHLTVLVGDSVHRDKYEVSVELLDAMRQQLGTCYGLVPGDVR